MPASATVAPDAKNDTVTFNFPKVRRNRIRALSLTLRRVEFSSEAGWRMRRSDLSGQNDLDLD
jgi:hypothetical protein